MSGGENVVRLAAERGADNASVTMLRQAMTEAEAGELRDVLIIGTTPDHGIRRFLATNDAVMMLGMLELLREELVAAMAEVGSS